jgi:prepilin-type N-terminal cleavage/methylation domain-containing protein
MPRRDDRGFTVVEVLVALAAAAMTLAAIANLTHGSARTGFRAAERLAEVALGRTLLSFPVDRAGAAEPLSGEAVGGLRWTLAMSQPTDETIAGAPGGGWTPAIVRLDVRQAGGADWSVETVRLVKAVAK